jgi:tetratricopeptide (TPR) repeat protein
MIKTRFEIIEKRVKRFTSLKIALFSLFFVLYSIELYSQDSIPAAVDLSEEKELKFQKFFFKALSEKSITNYQKAIENLESCNEVLPNDIAVLFEFSKNYLLLNKTLEAQEYINKALEQDKNSVWLLLHLVEIHKKDRNFSQAIKVQEEIALNYPKRKIDLVRLLVQDRKYDEAVSLMILLEKNETLSSSLQRLKISLQKRKNKTAKKPKTVGLEKTLIEKFENEKSYAVLKKILDKATVENEFSTLLKYSNQGITLFPAQPYVYLTNAKSLNYQKRYKKALTVLKDGLDFVIENKMEVDFYEEMIISYEKLGDKINLDKYRKRAKKLSNK